MSGHTPGTWKLKHGNCITDADGELVATCGYRVRVGSREDQANANLIAAAPTLLEALRELSRLLEREIGSGLHWPQDHACAECVPHSDILVAGFRCGRHAALAAIAKAEGEGA